MIFFAHLIIGYWLFLKFGYWQVIPLAVIFDIDHLIGYIIRKRRNVSSPLTNMQTLFTHPRSWIHSLTGFLIFFLPSLIFVPWYAAASALATNLLLDFDKAGIFILPPFTKRLIYGPLPINYDWSTPTKKKINRLGYIPSLIFIAIMLFVIYFRIGL